MKATIENGLTVEGTPQEMSEFISIYGKGGPVPKIKHEDSPEDETAEQMDSDKEEDKPLVMRKKRGKYRYMTKEQKAELAEHIISNDGLYSASGLVKKVQKRTPSGYEYRIIQNYLRRQDGIHAVKRGTYIKFCNEKTYQKLFATNPSHKKEDTDTEWKKHVSEKQKKRMEFIHAKIRSYDKAGMNLNYNEAFRRASEEYQNLRQKKRKESKKSSASRPIPAVVKIFPQFELISADSMKILEGLSGDMIFKHTKLTRKVAESSLQPRDDKFWDFELWRDFCSEFMNRSKEIADCFLKPNKFTYLANIDAIVFKG